MKPVNAANGRAVYEPGVTEGAMTHIYLPDSKRSLAPLDRRAAERAPIMSDISFTREDRPEDGPYIGTLRDLSKSGCQIVAYQPPDAGTRITLTLYLPDGQSPLCLTDTIVCQVRGQVFGVKFPSLTGEERRRLQALIFKKVTFSTHHHDRRAFRIA